MLGRERERESLAIVIIWWWWWEFFNLPSLIKSRNFFSTVSNPADPAYRSSSARENQIIGNTLATNR